MSFLNSLQKTGLLWYFWSQSICIICCFSCDGASEKTKSRLQKWGFVPFCKKGKCAIKGVMEGAPLTQEGICQVYQLIEFLGKEQSNTHVKPLYCVCPLWACLCFYVLAKVGWVVTTGTPHFTLAPFYISCAVCLPLQKLHTKKLKVHKYYFTLRT